MDSLLSNLKLDFVIYLQLMFRVKDNRFCLFLAQHKHICTHPFKPVTYVVLKWREPLELQKFELAARSNLVLSTYMFYEFEV